MDKNIIAKNIDAVKILYRYGLKITRPRLCVLNFLMQVEKPVSAKMTANDARRNYVDQATVYRILDLFQEKDIINRIDLKEEFAYFEIRDTVKDHHHIICTECKKVKDFTGCNYKKLANSALQQTDDFVKITNHSFELFGVCKSCA